MGSSISKAMKNAMQEQQKEIQYAQKTVILQQRQSQLAIQFARGKEQFQWFQAFFFIITPLIIIGAVKKQNPVMAIPLLPLSFVYAYQYDMFYHNKMYRIRQEAERLIREEPELFYLPENSGLVSREIYDQMLNIKKK